MPILVMCCMVLLPFVRDHVHGHDEKQQHRIEIGLGGLCSLARQYHGWDPHVTHLKDLTHCNT